MDGVWNIFLSFVSVFVCVEVMGFGWVGFIYYVYDFFNFMLLFLDDVMFVFEVLKV